MSVNTNYTQMLKDNLYACIEACQETYQVCLESIASNQALDIQTRKACVSVVQKCLETCQQTVNSCSVYIKHATETDSISDCQSVVETCNICIKVCRSIIEHCNHVNKKCFDVIKADKNVFQDCIDACRKCIEQPDL